MKMPRNSRRLCVPSPRTRRGGAGASLRSGSHWWHQGDSGWWQGNYSPGEGLWVGLQRHVIPTIRTPKSMTQIPGAAVSSPSRDSRLDALHN